MLQQDNYYKDYPGMPFEERVKQNFDHPDSMDTPLMAEHVRRLREGQTIERPTYDFANFRRADSTVRFAPRSAIIVEGILIFENKTLRDLMDIKIFVDTDADLRFIRRLVRDIRERGRTMEMVVDQYMTTVRPMHMEFVEPSQTLCRCNHSRRRLQRGRNRPGNPENSLPRPALKIHPPCFCSAGLQTGRC